MPAAPTITVEVQPINIKVNAPPRAPVNVQPSTAAPIVQAKPATGAAGPRVQVVDAVPQGLRDAAAGSRLSNIAKLGEEVLGGIGAVFSGVSAGGVALGVAGFGLLEGVLAQPAGLGSDMIGGKPFGSPAPNNKISDPRDTGAWQPPSASPRKPFGDPRTTNKQQTSRPADSPRTPIGDPRTQTRPQPYQPTESPKTAPFDPSSITSPSPRSRPGLGELVDTPTRTKKPLKTDSPFDLTTVGLNDYGGVNLAYPIAQKLSKLATEISLLKDEPRGQLDFQPFLEKIDTSIKDALSRARIETTVKLPATTNLVAKLPATTNITTKLPVAVDLATKLPVNVDLATKLPVAVDLATKLPVNVDLATKLPVAVDLATKLPVNVDLATKLPVAVDLATKLPVAVDLATKLPVNVDLATKLPVAVDLTTKLPVNVDLATKLPVAVDLTTKLPVNVDVKAKLQPEPIKPNLKKLQECCETLERVL